MAKITLCGSTKFRDDFNRLNRDLSLQGHVVYSVAFFVHTEAEAVTPNEKLLLDSIHMRKIAESDRIHVVNPGGYIGESTRREIYFAKVMDKTITFEEYGPEAIQMNSIGWADYV